MTAFPSSSDFADGIAKPPEKQRDLIDATKERIGTLPSSYSGFGHRPLFVKADETGPYPVQGTDTIDGGNAILANHRHGFGAIKATDYVPVANAVELDHENGFGHRLSLTSNLSANGITFVSLPSGDIAIHLLKITQDATGGRTFGGLSNVNAGFSSTDFDFGGVTIALPSGANDYVVVALYWWGAGKVDVRELLTQV